jgi:DNA polymerase elongation subunit (family B)
MGFDIEVNSSNPTAMPNASKTGDKIFQISCVFSKEGSTEYQSHLLTLGECEKFDDKVIVHEYKTEGEILNAFTNLIQKENPNVIVGYNILGFDIPYMIDRARLNMCIGEFDKLGFHKYNHAKERVIKWSSSAYKNQEFQFLDGEGRLFVDLLPLVKRDYKLDNYKLKTVSEHFLGASKDPLSVIVRKKPLLCVENIVFKIQFWLYN